MSATKEITMETCYDYLGCEKTNCVMYGKTDGMPCWEVEGTVCNSLGFKLMKDEMEGETIKEYLCHISGCIYYKFANTAKTV
jgi:hypothetical protein